MDNGEVTRMRVGVIGIGFALMLTGAVAQTNTFPASGNVGIGTTSPAETLAVRGKFSKETSTGIDGTWDNFIKFGHFSDLESGTTYANRWHGIDATITAGPASANKIKFRLYPGSFNNPTPVDVMTLQGDGNVGIGTANPLAKVQIIGPISEVSSISNARANAALWIEPYSQSSWGIAFGSYTGQIQYIQGMDEAQMSSRPLVLNPFAGNVGIGTTSPSAKLEVSGNLRLTSGSGGAITFQDGTVQSTAYTGVVWGGDYAESMDVTGDRTKYEPGDLLVLDTDNPGKILKSIEPYSTTVAGIYSTKPGTVGRRQTTPRSETEVPMAMIGVVPTKVTAENGSIKVGDLLVSSSMPGYAMKGTDRSRMLGAVIGKAMGTLQSGAGVIEVLVTLQ